MSSFLAYLSYVGQRHGQSYLSQSFRIFTLRSRIMITTRFKYMLVVHNFVLKWTSFNSSCKVNIHWVLQKKQ